jgi:hypothetical protein
MNHLDEESRPQFCSGFPFVNAADSLKGKKDEQCAAGTP